MPKTCSMALRRTRMASAQRIVRICALRNLPRDDGDPYGNRTRVFAVRGRRPRPLDEGAACGGARPLGVDAASVKRVPSREPFLYAGACMMRRMRSVFCLAVATFAALPLVGTPAVAGTVTVQVRDAAGAPVADAVVFRTSAAHCGRSGLSGG